jgi:hypothetical protein
MPFGDKWDEGAALIRMEPTGRFSVRYGTVDEFLGRSPGKPTIQAPPIADAKDFLQPPDFKAPFGKLLNPPLDPAKPEAEQFDAARSRLSAVQEKLTLIRDMLTRKFYPYLPGTSWPDLMQKEPASEPELKTMVAILRDRALVGDGLYYEMGYGRYDLSQHWDQTDQLFQLGPQAEALMRIYPNGVGMALGELRKRYGDYRAFFRGYKDSLHMIYGNVDVVYDADCRFVGLGFCFRGEVKNLPFGAPPKRPKPMPSGIAPAPR